MWPRWPKASVNAWPHQHTCKHAKLGPLFVDPQNILLAIHSGPPTAQAAPAAWPGPTLSHCVVESWLHFSKRKEKTKRKKKTKKQKQNRYDAVDLGVIKGD